MDIFDIVGDFDLKIKLYQLDEEIVKIWKYKECICIIRKNPMLDVDNCYVMHPKLISDKQYETGDYEVTMDLNCHGGITYNDTLPIGGNFEKRYCLGFDYAHSGDWSKMEPFGHYTSIEEKTTECESLAQQIIEYFENA